MKRQILAAILAGVLALSFVSCKKKTTEETTAAQTTAAETTAAETTEETTTAETTKSSTTLTKDDYSFLLNEGGFLDGYTASDYIDIPDLKSVTFSMADYEISDDEMFAYLSDFLAYFSEDVTDRAVEDQDYVSIDYIGYVDGKTSDGMQAEDSTVQAGTNQFIDDFLYQIIGHKPGETFDIEVTFPDPYTNNTDLSGKDAVFTVTINYIIDVPELNDELIKENLEFTQEYFADDTIQDAQDVKDFVNNYNFENNYESDIYEYFYKSLSLKKDLDENLTKFGYNYLNNSFVTAYSMTIDDVITENDLDPNYFDEEIIAETKMILFFQAIAEEQNITITDADIEEQYGTEYLDQYKETYGEGYMACILMQRKAMDYIREQVTLK